VISGGADGVDVLPCHRMFLKFTAELLVEKDSSGPSAAGWADEKVCFVLVG
jgi:hypothetical protein